MSRIAAVASILILTGFLAAVPAVAGSSPAPRLAGPEPTHVQVLIPSQLTAGNSSFLIGVLHDAVSGLPIPGENLSFARHTDFGWLALGTVPTNSKGMAYLSYQPVAAGTVTVNVTFEGDASYGPSNGSIAFMVLAGASAPPPLLPVDRTIALVVLAVVGGVWLTYAVVVTLILGIRADRPGEAEEETDEDASEVKRLMTEEPKASKGVSGVANRATLVIAVAALVLGGGALAFAFVNLGAQSTAPASPTEVHHYTPQTVNLQVAVIPDFRGSGWDSFVPDQLVVHENDTVKITVYNADTMEHGFAINAFGVDQTLPAATTDAGGNITPSVTVITFVASQSGAFTFYCTMPCGPGHTTMEGTLTVQPDD